MGSNSPKRNILTGSAVWVGEDLVAHKDWVRPLGYQHLQEIDEALNFAKTKVLSWRGIKPSDFPLPSLRLLLEDVADELEEGRGLIKLSGIPVERYAAADLKLIFQGISLHLGFPLSQSVSGERMVEITDEGVGTPERRGQVQTEEGETFLSSRARVHSTGKLRFHTDRCDAVALLTISQGQSGGASKVVSIKAIHNAMAQRRPDLLELLFKDYPRSRLGEETRENEAFYPLPIFAWCGDAFTSHYSRTYIEAAQLNSAAPKLSSAQVEALDLLHALAGELCYEMTLEPGDIQILNNHLIYHARDAYEDDQPTGKRRLLYRLWLSMPNSRALPDNHAILWGDVRAGAKRGGISSQ